MHTPIKPLFPIFKHHPGLTYLDSAATSLKPSSVVDAITAYYERYSTNVGRGLYPLAEEATAHIEDVRTKTAAFIGSDPEEIIFTRNTTESMNLLAFSLGKLLFPVIASSASAERGDPENKPWIAASQTPRNDRKNIVVTAMEHHSNFLPWERLARETGAELRVVPFSEDGTIDTDILGNLIDEHTGVLSFTAVSNVFGTINPVKTLIGEAKRRNPNTLTIVDAAQAAGHLDIDVADFGCDFLTFSGHKMFGPTGIGILYGKKELLETLPPYQVGGGMVSDAFPDQACQIEPEYRGIPYRFEAGTPDIAAIIGFGAAIDFVSSLGIETIRNHEESLITYTTKRLRETFGEAIRLLGPEETEKRGGIISFTLEGIHPHDLAHILGESGICIRAGEHCASPLHRSLDLSASARVSFSVYNDEKDADRLIAGMEAARRLISH